LSWTAAKATGTPRPLEDFLKCSKADERRVRKVAWRLKEAIRQSKRPSIEDYVKTLAARVDLPASIVKSAVELLEKNRRLLAGKNPWVSAATALWLASFKKLGLLKALAEAAGATLVGVRNTEKDEGMKGAGKAVFNSFWHLWRCETVAAGHIRGVDRRCGL
jgi:transcription initiation factor TFIIIB Brf1 subunit/transcription initiation factor TFIIB